MNFVKKLDKFILYGLVVTGLILIIFLIIGLCFSRKCIRKDIKTHDRNRDKKQAGSIAMRNFKQATAPLLPAQSTTPTYNLVLQNPPRGSR